MLSTIALGLGIFNTIKYQYSPKEADRDEGVKQPRFVRPTSKTDHAVTKFLYDRSHCFIRYRSKKWSIEVISQ